MTAAHDRLAATIRAVTGNDPGPEVSAVSLTDPAALANVLRRGTGLPVIVAGALDRRLVLVQNECSDWTAADLSGAAHRSRAWPTWTEGNLVLDRPSSWLSRASLTQAGLVLGQVELTDMQLGVSLADIVARTRTLGPDIVGVSATFGQHDLLTDLLDQFMAKEARRS